MVRTRKVIHSKVADQFTIEKRLEQFTEMLENQCPILRSTAIFYFRKLFATNRDETKLPETSNFYRRIVTGVVKSLKDEKLYEDTKLDAIWVITNMCCINDQVSHLIVNANCIDILTKYVASPDSRIANQCIWALANIAADCTDCKLKCRSTKLIKKIASKISNTPASRGTDIGNAIWCINNITSGGRVEWPKTVMKSLVSGLHFHLVDKNGIPSDWAEKILWTLASLADDMHNVSRIDNILNQAGLLETAMSIFVNQNLEKLHCAALRLIGNVAVGSDAQTDRLISLPGFRQILKAGMKSNKHCSEIAWICSNISAGTTRHLNFLLEDDEFYFWVLTGIHSAERRLHKECLWIVANMLATGDETQIGWLVSQGVAHHIPRLLRNEDVRLNEKALNAAVSILREHPYQKPLFEELNVLGFINDELLTDDAPFIFRQQKRTIEMLLNADAPPKRAKVEAASRFILYTDVELTV